MGLRRLLTTQIGDLGGMGLGERFGWMVDGALDMGHFRWGSGHLGSMAAAVQRPSFPRGDRWSRPR